MGSIRKSTFYYHGEVHKLCGHYSRSLEFISELSLHNSKLLSNILIMRQEDCLINPLFAAAKLYEFIGVEHDRNTMDCLMRVTMIAAKSKCTWNNKILEEKLLQGAWQSELPLAAIRAVEGDCKQTMIDYGYDLFTSRERRDFVNRCGDPHLRRLGFC